MSDKNLNTNTNTDFRVEDIDNSKKDKEIQLSLVYLLWVLFGVFGIHRIYLKRVFSGIILGMTFILGIGLIFYVLWHYISNFEQGIYEFESYSHINNLIMISISLLGINFIWYYIDAYLIAKIVKSENDKISKNNY